jgi:hypothetical protein
VVELVGSNALDLQRKQFVLVTKVRWVCSAGMSLMFFFGVPIVKSAE